MVEVISSPFNLDLILAGMILFIGVLLLFSLRQEVKQRDELIRLTGRLGDANIELQTLDKARAEFISIASHQLRTPPATVKWYLAAMLTGDFGRVTPKLADALRKAEISNNNLITLIDDLLNVSGIERGRMEFIFEKTDFEKLVGKAVELLTPQARVKKLKLVYHKPREKFPIIIADPEKLQQVANNLVDNAIKYTKKGAIDVRLTRTGDDLVMSIADSGKGMTPDDLAAIFQKYKRGKDSILESHGLGLGLYVAKEVLRHHHGEIWAESQGLGKGSTFFVRLPIYTDLTLDTELDITAADLVPKK